VKRYFLSLFLQLCRQYLRSLFAFGKDQQSLHRLIQTMNNAKVRSLLFTALLIPF
jgi:hypothetical protein